MGAAIAAGSQEEKGYWALLVIAPKKITKTKKEKPNKAKKSKEAHPQYTIKIKLTIKKQSPTRLVKTVIRPESNLELLL